MNKPDILVFCHHDPPRLKYVLDWIFNDCWKKTYLLTTDEKTAHEWTGPRLAYGPIDPHIRPWIIADPSGFGEHNTLSPEDVVWQDEQPWIYYQPDAQASLPADILAGTFWFLSRQEEYTHFEPDSHNRFSARESLSFKRQCLDRPVVDEWVLHLHHAIVKVYPEWKIPTDTFAIQATYDIDYAWRYLYKSPSAQIKTLLRDMIVEGPMVFWQGLQTVLGFRDDPYDLYTTWVAQDAVLFFPVGDTSFFDRNHSWTQKNYQALIRSCDQSIRVGIHPSYGTMHDPQLLEKELDRFEEITGTAPIRSRQHYLRFDLPETYQILEERGIEEEWSMGYADQPGFRAGTSRSFLWYDLVRDRTSQMRIYPFEVMDTTLLHYLKLNPDEAALLIHALMSKIKQTQGQLTTLAHNNSEAGVDRIWRGWKKIWPEQSR